MRMSLSGKLVLITGASSGIGEELARHLAKEGCVLILAARRKPLLDKLKMELQAAGTSVSVAPTDLRQPAQIARLASFVRRRHGKLDILVNNAGILRNGTVGDAGMKAFRENMETNFFGLLDLTQRVLPLIRRRENGMVVNVSSPLGRRSVPGMAAYCASKSALEALSESLRLEEARHGIQVLVARPDLTKTPMNSGAGAVHSAAEAAARIVKAMKKRRRVVNGTWRAALLVLIAAPLAPLLDFVMKWTYRRRLK